MIETVLALLIIMNVRHLWFWHLQFKVNRSGDALLTEIVDAIENLDKRCNNDKT